MKKILTIDSNGKDRFNGLTIFLDNQGIYWVADEYSTRKASKRLLKQLKIN